MKILRLYLFAVLMAVPVLYYSVRSGQAPSVSRPIPIASTGHVGQKTPPHHTGNKVNDLMLDGDDALSTIGLGLAAGCTANKSFYMGIDAEKVAYWSVTCDSGKAFNVAINPDAKGSSSIMDCAILKNVAGVDCFRTFDSQDAERLEHRKGH